VKKRKRKEEKGRKKGEEGRAKMNSERLSGRRKRRPPWYHGSRGRCGCIALGLCQRLFCSRCRTLCHAHVIPCTPMLSSLHSCVWRRKRVVPSLPATGDVSSEGDDVSVGGRAGVPLQRACLPAYASSFSAILRAATTVGGKWKQTTGDGREDGEQRGSVMAKIETGRKLK